VGLSPGALPDFPWDSLERHRARAAAHTDGIVDLSVGTPVDPTPELIQAALAASANAPRYPTTQGSVDLREAIASWFERRRGVPGLDPGVILPTIGSKEFVALLPALLGLAAGDAVVIPEVAYPTYDVGARLVGASTIAASDVSTWAGNADVALVWVNSPSNPTGAVCSARDLAAVVNEARKIGAVVASDECYAELAWAEPYASGGVPSILDPAVCGGSHEGLLAAYSLSKQSNLAGYRAAFVAGDRALVSRLLEVRKHLGMIVPGPIQAAMTVALGDDAHVAAQRATYGRRRGALLPALRDAGFDVSASEAGLYLWATRGEASLETIAWLADRGILGAPGSFYGLAGDHHVRLALTAPDERIASAVRRLARSR
jgi:succinyldiaminopimelate transaminase